MTETLWERRECVSAEVEDSLVLLDLETLLYHSLNKTAASVWEALATPRTPTEVSVALCDVYDIQPEACRASVDRLLATLEEKNLIAPKVATQG